MRLKTVREALFGHLIKILTRIDLRWSVQWLQRGALSPLKCHHAKAEVLGILFDHRQPGRRDLA